MIKWKFKALLATSEIGRGMGLAMWRSEATYKDMQHIVEELGEDVYTALTNPDQNKCTDNECDGKLVITSLLPY